MLRVFLSYARQDRDRCEDIEKRITESYQTWYDRRIPGGQNWWSMILNKIENSEIFIYLISDHSLNSAWCAKEYDIANKLGRPILPIKVARINFEFEQKWPLKEILRNRVQILDFYDEGKSESRLFNSLIHLERGLNRAKFLTLEDINPSDLLEPDLTEKERTVIKQNNRSATLNFETYLIESGCSASTRRSYHRFVDRFLVDMVGLAEISADQRPLRHKRIPAEEVANGMTLANIKGWFESLELDGYSKETFVQARSALEYFVELAQKEHVLEKHEYFEIFHFLKNYSPKVAGRLDTNNLRIFTRQQIDDILAVPMSIFRKPAVRMRNSLVLNMLYWMALRRTELVRILWRDIEFENGVPFTLQRPADNGKSIKIDIPNESKTLINDWKNLITRPSNPSLPADSLFLRRVWKGGVIDESGITPDAIWRITQNAGYDASLGRVTPDDLRRSRTYHLYQSGVPIKVISQLLGHSSQIVTTVYIEEIEKNL